MLPLLTPLSLTLQPDSAANQAEHLLSLVLSYTAQHQGNFEDAVDALHAKTLGPAESWRENVDPEWKINEGQDLVVNWAAPAEGSRAHVDLTVSIDQHGATPGLLTCSFEDDGEGTVPAAIIDQLISSGVTGFPTGTITRQTVDKADVLDGCMDFAVSNPVQMEVDVVGFTPCVNQNDCPDGLTCNIELQICE